MKVVTKTAVKSGSAAMRFVENYLFNLAICSLALLLYFNHPYYLFLSPETKIALKYEFMAFVVLYPLLFSYCILIKKTEGLTKYENIKAAFTSGRVISLSERWTPGAKNAVLSYVVKIFFLPLMVNFLFGHITQCINSYGYLQTLPGSWITRLASHGYHLIINSLFLIDTVVFTIGYSIESEFLGSKISSVEPTAIGWFAALICYPPFNGAASQYIPLAKQEIVFSSLAFRNSLDVAVISLFVIYVWATIALGFKASNLTNRGIVRSGPYRFCRHPAYIAKNLAWWLEYLPFLSWMNAVALLGWNLIYLLRVVTEERHLSLDPDYVDYCKDVKWKFIPGVY